MDYILTGWSARPGICSIVGLDKKFVQFMSDFLISEHDLLINYFLITFGAFGAYVLVFEYTVLKVVFTLFEINRIVQTQNQ